MNDHAAEIEEFGRRWAAAPIAAPARAAQQTV
jgi:hypothetical protein